MGTTPFTSTVSSVLSSVTEQLQRSAFHTIPDMPQNFIDVRDNFWHTLDQLGSIGQHEGKQVVLVLDSIDQLSPIHGAHELAWLPAELPKNVKLILSTLPDEHGILKNMRAIIKESEQYVPVEELSQADCQSILHLWLGQARRRITEAQEVIFSGKIENKEIRPLYLKLIFDEIITWKSYESEAEVSAIMPSIESSILQLYARLERKHGGNTYYFLNCVKI